MKAELQLPPVAHVSQLLLFPTGVWQQVPEPTLVPQGGRQTGSPQHVVALQMYPGGHCFCPPGQVFRSLQQTWKSTQ